MKDKANDIIEKATTLFRQHGLQSVSMEEIALQSGISKKTLYENFQSKEILVTTSVHQIITRISKYIRVCADFSPNAISEMENFFSYVFDLPEILSPAFIRDLKKYYPESFLQLRFFRNNSIMPFIHDCLQRGVKEDVFRTDISKTNAGWLYCWQLQNVFEGESFLPDVKKIISDINDLFIHGIVNAKGLRLITVNKQNANTEKNMNQDSGALFKG